MESVDVVNWEDSFRKSIVRFTLNPNLWNDLSPDVKEIVEKDWYEVKFYTPGKKPNPQLTSIPSHIGGIYTFIVKPNIIPNSHLYLMYIVRAKKRIPKT